jgi:hypothetical protein
MGTAFDALRTALFGLSLSSVAGSHDDAQRLEQALSRAGYVIVPASRVWEVGHSSVCVGQRVLIIDGLTAEQARDAADALWRHDQRRATAGETA